ncbi:hypothetical protein VNO80_26557 [Phaseolus coccineus]|uniref:Uncharacterized protein n=1 Tax=Phaseolus coccineus TaxID=3886 RepID=A0AAN9LI79_PHACN
MSLHRARGDGDLTSDLSKMAGKGKQSYLMFMEMQNLCPSLGISVAGVILISYDLVIGGNLCYNHKLFRIFLSRRNVEMSVSISMFAVIQSH